MEVVVGETIAWDGTAAIERNTTALRRVLAGIVGMARLEGQFSVIPQQSAPPHDAAVAARGKPSPTLPRYLYLAVLRLLRPAESAARRLIIAAARTLVATLSPRRPVSAPVHQPGGVPLPPCNPGSALHPSRFPLLDPPRYPTRWRKPVSSSVPRICVPGLTERHRLPPPPSPGDPIDATRLARRIAALVAVLGDLPGQARRFARWRARRAARLQAKDGARPARRLWPLRFGRPPGSRSGSHRHDGSEIDGILAHTHSVAVFALDRPDTS
jgi:hypothetical protein